MQSFIDHPHGASVLTILERELAWLQSSSEVYGAATSQTPDHLLGPRGLDAEISFGYAHHGYLSSVLGVLVTSQGLNSQEFAHHEIVPTNLSDLAQVQRYVDGFCEHRPDATYEHLELPLQHIQGWFHRLLPQLQEYCQGCTFVVSAADESNSPTMRDLFVLLLALKDDLAVEPNPARVIQLAWSGPWRFSKAVAEIANGRLH